MSETRASESDDPQILDGTTAASDREFLLAELSTMREMRASLNSLVSTEISIFLAMVTATFVGLGFASDRFDFSNEVLTISIAALAIIALLGWALFTRVVVSRIEVVKYARNMNRVRNYFVQHDARIEMHASDDIHDDLPPFGAIGTSRPQFMPSGNTGMIAILNSVVLGVMVAMLANVAGIDRIVALVAVGGIVFMASLVGHSLYEGKRYRRADRAYRPRFPSSRS